MTDQYLCSHAGPQVVWGATHFVSFSFSFLFPLQLYLQANIRCTHWVWPGHFTVHQGYGLSPLDGLPSRYITYAVRPQYTSSRVVCVTTTPPPPKPYR